VQKDGGGVGEGAVGCSEGFVHRRSTKMQSCLRKTRP